MSIDVEDLSHNLIKKNSLPITINFNKTYNLQNSKNKNLIKLKSNNSINKSPIKSSTLTFDDDSALLNLKADLS